MSVHHLCHWGQKENMSPLPQVSLKHSTTGINWKGTLVSDYTLYHTSHREISHPKDVLLASVDTSGTTKEFCSQKCISAFNFRCSVCQRTSVVSDHLRMKNLYLVLDTWLLWRSIQMKCLIVVSDRLMVTRWSPWAPSISCAATFVSTSSSRPISWLWTVVWTVVGTVKARTVRVPLYR